MYILLSSKNGACMNVVGVGGCGNGDWWGVGAVGDDRNELMGAGGTDMRARAISSSTKSLFYPV